MKVICMSYKRNSDKVVVRLFRFHPRELQAYDSLKREGYAPTTLIRNFLIRFATERGVLPPKENGPSDTAKKGDASEQGNHE